jgi:hypothetical protein
MSLVYKKAIRENVSLIIGLIGPSGSGKTYTAMRLASGICGDKPFAVIDTEAGRAKHYADQFNFDHADLAAPFRPNAYIEAIKIADKAGYRAIVIDSTSHVWAGDGGVLDWQEEELSRMAGEDWKKRESCKMAAWIKPKMAHKKMVQQLLQVRAHLIPCFRAEEKIEMVKKDGKLVVQAKESITGLHGWTPVCEKNLPYELTCSFLLTADRPGIPQPIKLQEQHRHMFPLDKPISEDSGKLVAQWAAGAKVKAKKEPEPEKKQGKNDSKISEAELEQMAVDRIKKLMKRDGGAKILSVLKAKYKFTPAVLTGGKLETEVDRLSPLIEELDAALEQ